MEVIGKYKILGRIGEGAMGTVFKGFDPHLQRPVAIKVISERAFENPGTKERFFREARSAGLLSHENITTVYELGEANGLPFIVMEYLSGSDLRSVIASKEQLSRVQKLYYSDQICRGLQYSHSRDIIHRDLKPENIMILENDKVKIMDFGLARPESSNLTKKGTPIGTPVYMSPEQIRGLKVDKRTDIFSFGVLFYELLTYRTPFEGDNIAVISKILHEEPKQLLLENCDFFDELQQTISKCLQKKPEDRFHDSTELMNDVSAILDKALQGKKIHELLTERCSLPKPRGLHEATLESDAEEETSSIEPPGERKVGEVISHFQIIERLGGGGMGVVYKAEDLTLKRIVALKFLVPELTADDEARKRFLNEAQAASALDHPNICNIHEISETGDGQIFICMAYYVGENLKQRLAKGKLEIADSLNIAQKIGRGLAKAHQRDIIHRDIKPANIFVTEDGEVKILDFGLAKLAGGSTGTKAGTMMGTLRYMSPEQVQGFELDPRTDIWSFGVLMYEMLTGQLPFHSDYDLALIYSIVNEDPVAVSQLCDEIPSELENVITKALKKDLDDRYGSMQNVLDDIERIRLNLSGMRGQDVLQVDPHNQEAKEGIKEAGRGSVLVAQKYTRDRARSYSSKGLWMALSVLIILGIAGIRIFFKSSSEENKDNSVPTPAQTSEDLRQSSEEPKRDIIAGDVDVSKLTLTVSEAQQKMRAEKEKSEKAGAIAFAATLYENALSKASQANTLFTNGDRASLLGAQSAFREATDLFTQVLQKLENEAFEADSALSQAKQQLLQLETGTNLRVAPQYQRALAMESSGNSQFSDGEFGPARLSFDQARDWLDELSSDLLTDRLQAAEDSMNKAKDRIDRNQLSEYPEEYVQYQNVDSLEQEAGIALSKSDFQGATELYNSAGTSYLEIAYQIEDKEAIRILLNRYKASIESGDMQELKSLFIKKNSLERYLADTWSGFFNTASEIRVTTELGDPKIQKNFAKVEFNLEINYSQVINVPPMLNQKVGKNAKRKVVWELKKVHEEWIVARELQAPIK